MGKSINQRVIFLFLFSFFSQGLLIVGAENEMKADEKHIQNQNIRGLQSAQGGIESPCVCLCMIATGEIVPGNNVAYGVKISYDDPDHDNEESEESMSESKDEESKGNEDTKGCVCTCVQEDCHASDSEDHDGHEHSHDEEDDGQAPSSSPQG